MEDLNKYSYSETMGDTIHDNCDWYRFHVCDYNFS